MNKTQIFKSYSDFRNREDKTLNGVSEEFAQKNPKWEEQNATNKGCYNCSSCSSCSYCSSCSDCSSCSSCSSLKNSKPVPTELNKLTTPKIKNIHKAVLEAASNKDALEMGKWHICDTTHCRAGWVVTLAGEEGKKLEKFFNSTLIAAMKIYNESSTIKVGATRFFESNEVAMADMKRCAELELAESK